MRQVIIKKIEQLSILSWINLNATVVKNLLGNHKHGHQLRLKFITTNNNSN